MRKFIYIIILIINISFLISFLPLPLYAFSDTTGHWAERDIMNMQARGILLGDGGGYFYPERNLSRQEAISTLVRLAGIQESAANRMYPDMMAFSPKDAAAWAYQPLLLAWQNGVIDESEVRALNWAKSANRQEVAVWMAKIYDVNPIANYFPFLYFYDANKINSQKAPYIAPLVQEGIILGDNNFFRPYDPIKRAEMASLLKRLDETYPGGSALYSAGTSPYILHPETITPGLSARSSLIRGELRGVDWSLGIAEIMVNGSLNKYNIASNYIAQQTHSYIWQPPFRYGDEVEVTLTNGWVSNIQVIQSNDRYGERDYNRDEYIIYRAQISDYYERDDDIRISDIYYLSSSAWRSISGSKTLSMISRVDVYDDGNKVNKSKLDDYRRDGKTVYIAFNEDRQEAERIRLQLSSENRYDDEIKEIRASPNRIVLDYYNRSIDVDESSLIISAGELLDYRDLQRYDRIYLITDEKHGREWAAVIFIK